MLRSIRQLLEFREANQQHAQCFSDGIRDQMVIEIEAAGIERHVAFLSDHAARYPNNRTGGGNMVDDDGIGTDTCVTSDGDGAQQFGSASHNDVVTKCRMPFAFIPGCAP